MELLGNKIHSVIVDLFRVVLNRIHTQTAYTYFCIETCMFFLIVIVDLLHFAHNDICFETIINKCLCTLDIIC